MRRSPVVAALAVAALAACGGGGSESGPVTVRLGYFANVTHAPAIVGLRNGIFAQELGSNVALTTNVFNAGPEAVEALFSEAIDITYIGPSPAINAYARSNGEAVRVIAGAASGGASLVVQPGITSAAQLRGKRLGTPQLGNTQDVALRAWLRQQGLSTNLEGGGDVSVVPQSNAQSLETFRAGQIQGAWVPEPWAARMVIEGGATVLVDERTLWPGGRFITTLVLVRTAFLRDHPDVVARFLRGHLRAIDWTNAEPAAARDTVNAGIAAVVGRSLPPAVLERAWGTLAFTADPIASSLHLSAQHAVEVGLLQPVQLTGIFDLAPLNAMLTAANRPAIAAQ